MKADATVQNAIKSGSYEYTGFGAAESTIDTTPDGTLVYAPTFSGNVKPVTPPQRTMDKPGRRYAVTESDTHATNV